MEENYFHFAFTLFWIFNIAQDHNDSTSTTHYDHNIITLNNIILNMTVIFLWYFPGSWPPMFSAGYPGEVNPPYTSNVYWALQYLVTLTPWPSLPARSLHMLSAMTLKTIPQCSAVSMQAWIDLDLYITDIQCYSQKESTRKNGWKL